MIPRFLVPGDLIVHNKVVYDSAWLHRFGLVVGVMYRRAGPGHLGCEDRINVYFPQDGRFETLCDCEMIKLDELP